MTTHDGGGGLTGGAASGRAPDTFRYRPVRPDELGACTEIWRTSINDYVVPLGQGELPTDTGTLLRLYQHLHTTDPQRFVVAVEDDPTAESGERVVAFAAAVQRERLWFLSMCFVLPGIQGAGVGRTLLEHAGASPGSGVVRSTATDSAQPISNALYASIGIVPRVPLLNLVGLPRRPEGFEELPSGISPVPFDELAGRASGEDGHARLVATVDALDRETLGVAHPQDHRWLRESGRRGWLYHGPDGSPVAYGYVSETGRVGPVAARDRALVTPILGHLTSSVVPTGAFALWLPGDADAAVIGALRAGFRLEPFPILLCWDTPFVDLQRYLPISPGLL